MYTQKYKKLTLGFIGGGQWCDSVVDNDVYVGLIDC